VCGKLRANYKQLHLHMVQRHKQPAPPLEKLLPAGALAALTAAVGAGSSGGGGGSSGGNGSSSKPSHRQISRSASGAAAAVRSNWSWAGADPWVARNSSTRTLGRVERYCSSGGLQFIPPDGHQISLKYVLAREGVEVRTVQRAARAVDAALADSLHSFLQDTLLARPAHEAQRVQDVLVVVSDKGAHTAVLQQARRAGIQSIAVCGRIRRFKGADLTLRWQWLVTGRLECAPPE
jgi:hypothetical protein